jgi:small subunit ribosomal protein S17
MTATKVNNKIKKEGTSVSEKKEKETTKKFTGVVVSDKSDKTVVVAVKNVQVHPLYKKRYATTKHYKVHDEKNEYSVGDEITFVECRPLSKNKRWRAIKA